MRNAENRLISPGTPCERDANHSGLHAGRQPYRHSDPPGGMSFALIEWRDGSDT